MPLVALAYHSHHVVGPDYARNDHVAFARDLDLVTDAGWRIVPLGELVAAHRAGSGEALLALTFDDGPAYDVADFVHPAYGAQPSFLDAMTAFRARRGRGAQPSLHATSFVIASPDARRVMETHHDREYTYLGEGSMGDGWWNEAIDTGLIAIANHSWDHLHPALPRVAHSTQARGDFAQVRTDADAHAQIAQAAAWLDARTRGRAARHFAYPFGHWNAFLADDWFPRAGSAVCEAAFTTEPRAFVAGESRWTLPRYVCGHHWRTPDELASLLAQARSTTANPPAVA